MSENHSSESIEYRPVVGFPGYRVGNDGSVWSCRGRGGSFAVAPWRRLKQRPASSKKYLCVCLCGPGSSSPNGKNCRVHRLVLAAFAGSCPEGMQCRHLDGNPVNNSSTNLKWGTVAENMADKVRHGKIRGEANHAAKLTDTAVREIRRRFAAGGVTKSQLAREFHVGMSVVCRVINRTKWKHIE